MSTIPPGPEDPYAKLKVSPIGEKLKESGDQEQYIPDFKSSKKKKWGFLYLISELFLRLFPRGSHQTSLKELDQDLRQIRKLFFKLQNFDLSEDSNFLEELMHAWKSFITHFQPIALSRHPIILQIRAFYDEIHSYPNTIQFSFGYYLSHYAGEEWIPFPYIEILRNLYLEAQTSKESSKLEKWIVEIDQMIKFK